MSKIFTVLHIDRSDKRNFTTKIVGLYSTLEKAIKVANITGEVDREDALLRSPNLDVNIEIIIYENVVDDFSEENVNLSLKNPINYGWSLMHYIDANEYIRGYA